MLDIKLFNSFQATLNGQPLTQFRSAKARALLVYLLQESDQSHDRGRLAGLLWPDFPEGTARRNLSQTLSSLRKTLNENQQDALYLETTVHTVAIYRSKLAEGVLAVDTLAFERLVQSADLKSLQQAADLYSGPFLMQFQGGDSDLFENWVLAQRERLQQLALDLFSKLADILTKQNDIESAIDYARRQLTLAPWQEASHRQLMRLLALDGRRIEALGQYDTLCDVLMEELGVGPAPETDTLYDQILAGDLKPLNTNKAEAIPVPQTPFQAPPQSPHFVGREVELSEVAQLVLHNNTHTDVRTPIALVGMGGIGKTAFVTHQAHQLKDHFTDGVLWANTLTSSPTAILDLWAKAYGYDYSGLSDLESKASAVRSLLANKQILIVLDNVDDVAQVRPLLPNSPTCAVLLTTRNLDIASALNAQPIELKELTTENSQQLMVKILGEDRVFNMTGAAVATQRIGELLHHLPLAVEIVAQRLKSRIHMPVAAMAMRLEDTQQRLGLKISDQAVRASFQVSWEGLPLLAQQVFRGMGIFGGRSFSAETLAAALNLDLFDTEDQLYSLTALSLVKADGKVRYQQHPLLADFALEQLQVLEMRKLELIYDQFFNHIYQFVAEYHSDYGKLSSEWTLLSAAIQTAHQQKRWQTVIDLTQTLSKPWFLYSRFYDAKKGYKAAEKAARQLNKPMTSAEVCLNRAEVEIELSNYDGAWEQLTVALQLFTTEEEDLKIGQTKYQQGLILFEQGEAEKSQRFLEESQQIFSELNADQEIVRAKALLGWLHFEAHGDPAEGLKLAHEGLSLIEQNQQQNDETYPSLLRLLASIAIRKEDLEAGRQWAVRAEAISRQTNNLAELGATYYLLTVIERQNQAYSSAADFAQKGLDLFIKLGNKRYQGLFLQERCAISCSKGEFEAGIQHIKKAKSIFKQIKDRMNYAFCLRTLGAIHVEQNRPDLAKKLWLEAHQVAEHINNRYLKDQLSTMLLSLPPTE